MFYCETGYQKNYFVYNGNVSGRFCSAFCLLLYFYFFVMMFLMSMQHAWDTDDCWCCCYHRL